MTIRVEKTLGIRGTAKVTVSDMITVSFVDGIKEGFTYKIFPEDAPSYLVKSGTYAVTLDPGGVRVISVAPTEGKTAVAHFKAFAAPFDKQTGNRLPPTPFLSKERLWVDPYDGSKKLIPARLQCVALYRIDEDQEYAGFEVPYIVPYAFHESQYAAGEVAIRGSGKKTCVEFLETHINLEEAILSWHPTTILPQLEKLILQENRPVLVEMGRSGYVKTVSPVPAGFVQKKTVSKKSKAS